MIITLSKLQEKLKLSDEEIVDIAVSKIGMSPSDARFLLVIEKGGNGDVVVSSSRIPDENVSIATKLLRTYKHVPGRHNQRNHGNRGDKPAVGSDKHNAQQQASSGGGATGQQATPVTPKKTKPLRGDGLSADDKKYGILSKQMRDFEKHSVSLPHEVSAAYDLNGKKLFEQTDGIESEITFNTDQLRMMKDAVITHNHPTVKGFSDGASFSLSDIQLLANTGAVEVRAISEKYVHIARPKKIGQHSMLGNTALLAARDELSRLKAHYQPLINSKKISYDEAQQRLNHELWENVAKMGFIEYQRIPR